MFGGAHTLQAGRQASGQTCNGLGAGLRPVVALVAGLELLADDDAGLVVYDRRERVLRVDTRSFRSSRTLECSVFRNSRPDS